MSPIPPEKKQSPELVRDLRKLIEAIGAGASIRMNLEQIEEELDRAAELLIEAQQQQGYVRESIKRLDWFCANDENEKAWNAVSDAVGILLRMLPETAGHLTEEEREEGEAVWPRS